MAQALKPGFKPGSVSNVSRNFKPVGRAPRPVARKTGPAHLDLTPTPQDFFRAAALADTPERQRSLAEVIKGLGGNNKGSSHPRPS